MNDVILEIKGLLDEDFLNYKLPSMFITTAHCTFKCDIESGMSCCQNSSLAKIPPLHVPATTLIDRYLRNPITKAIVIGGLEPFDQFEEIFEFIKLFREEYDCIDSIVIYTGFNEAEIANQIEKLQTFKNIIVKFGRFIPDQDKHYDNVLGVYLASPNQYAKEIS